MSRPRTHTACTFPDCALPHSAKGYCKSHYQQLWRTGEVQPVIPAKSYGETCTFEGCGRQHKEKGYCATHAMQLYRTGKVKPIRALTQTQQKAS